MDENRQRNLVKSLYPHSPRWARKVDRMSREQVFAIYKRSQEEQAAEEADEESKYAQLTLF